MNKVLIDIPMPENCEDCLICSLVPEHTRLDMREHGLQYKLYCKVTGACVSGKGRDEDCPLNERKRGKWITVNDAYNRISGKCSVCGWEAHMYEDDVVGMDYCPNCGASMEEGEQE